MERIFLKNTFRLERHGFTLIELLIVVAIIAILAAIAIPNFLAAQVRAKVARVQAEFHTITTALESYRVDNNEYPRDNRDDSALWDRQLFQITTPVSYISSNVIRDPFGRNEESATWSGVFYYYYGKGTGYWGSGSSWFAANPGFRAPIFDKPDTWGLASVAPNRWPDWDYVGENNQPYDLTKGFQTYDPSNGTVSNGDLFRWGP